MLLSEEFSGGHERHLPTGFHGGQCSERCDHCLPAAHIPLQEARHRNFARHICECFTQRALLRRGELERKTLPQQRGNQTRWL